MGSGVMSHDVQNVVGGVLLIICLGVYQWWCIKNGVSLPPRMFFRSYASYREKQPRKFWFNVIFYFFVMLVFLGVALVSLVNLNRAG